ncbi:uncharacterized protein LOC143375367 [Andrena cerasifolii]|uniref:uncharacterized protein LOC143375367 n=1 Tax=Andrena cerasifolii TaxID=2819439 RepID=UPI004037D94F
MQEDCDFQSIMEEKPPNEASLDVPAIAESSPETETNKSVPKDSTVDFQVLAAASSSEVFTRMELELRMNEYAPERQVSASKSLPESCTEESPSRLSYSDCDAILDVTYENLSYYNSTKAEKDSDSDFDDTLIFEDAEECGASGRNENVAESCCRSSCCERSMDEAFERRLDDFDRTSEDGFTAAAASAIKIEDDGGVDAGDEALTVELQEK